MILILPTEACDFCGGATFREAGVRLDHAGVIACTKCGLARLHRMPDEVAIARTYASNGYFVKDDDSESGIGYCGKGYLARQALLDAAREQVKLLSAYRAFSGASVIDVGCATGEFLFAARESGAKVRGIEPNPWAAERASTQYGLEVTAAAAEAVVSEGNRYDITVAREVIEHVSSPRRFLELLTEMTAPHGLVVITTPNYRLGLARADSWKGFQTSFEHLYFLSDEVLLRLGILVGLKPICWWTRGTGHEVLHTRAFCTGSPNFKKLRVLSVPARRVGSLLLRWGRWLHGTGSEEPWVPYGDGHQLLVVFEKPAFNA